MIASNMDQLFGTMRIAMLMACCLFLTAQVGSIQAQVDLIVPFEIGDKWVYSGSRSEQSNWPLDEDGNKMKSSSYRMVWVVVGDSFLNGRSVKVIRKDFYTFNGELSGTSKDLFTVDSSKMQFLDSDCEHSGVEWRDYLNTDLQQDFTEKLVCPLDPDPDREFHPDSLLLSFKRLPGSAPSQVFGNVANREEHTTRRTDMEGFGFDTRISAPGVGLLSFSSQYTVPFIGNHQYYHSYNLVGAVIAGEHYGDTRLTTSVENSDQHAAADGAELTIYPNPLNNQATMLLNSSGSQYKVSLRDMLGRDIGILAEGRIDNPGQQTLNVNTSNLAAGNYMAILEVDGRMQATTLLLKLP